VAAAAVAVAAATAAVAVVAAAVVVGNRAGSSSHPVVNFTGAPGSGRLRLFVCTAIARPGHYCD
jgi:hypothetical protein